MSDFASMPQRLESGSRAPGKIKYLVEKWLDESGSWVPMARFNAGSDADRREAFCSALGGEERVLDVEQDIELSRTVYA